VPVLLATGVLSSILPGGGNSDAAAIQRTITGFCQAVHDANYNAAYAYFSPHLQQTVTSYSDVPNVTGQWGKAENCTEFGNGSFLSVSGSSAQDTLTFTVNGQLGNTTVSGTVTFVKSGSSWQIDSIAT
jgi:hypothetical protein